MGRAREATLDLAGPLESLPGVGPKGRERLAAAGIELPIDLALVLPSRVVALGDARTVDELFATEPEEGTVVVRGRVRRVAVAFFRGRQSTKITIAGAARALVLSYPFRAHAAARLREGDEIVAVGPLSRDARGAYYVLAPKLAAAATTAPLVEYPPAVAAFSAAREAVLAHRSFPMAVPTRVAAGLGLAATALRDAHLGGRPEDLEEGRRALRTCEALAREVIARTEPRAPAHPIAPLAANALECRLGVALREGQARVVADVARDLASTAPMRRVVLGDVGTGKTLVACAAVVAAAEVGHLSVVFAPTSALVDQWVARLSAIALSSGASLRVAVVTQESRGEHDAWDVAVGTHALATRSLGAAPALLVVDEPQRTGTLLRETLVTMGKTGEHVPHLLLLTATPLPRTLALADDGVLATSVLSDEARSANVTTRITTDAALETTALADLRDALRRGERAFVVAARIAPGAGGTPGIADVAARVARALPEARIAVAHAQLSRDAQRDALASFRDGRCDLLVSTSVVEVGLDVPEATRIVVLSAERFGAAQLHQLRGRVGRGGQAAVAWLAHGPRVAPSALARLRSLAEESVGLAVARADLHARGPGDRLGVAQSGLRDAPAPIDRDAVARAADELLATDPELVADEAAGFRRVLARVRRGLRFEAAG